MNNNYLYNKKYRKKQKEFDKNYSKNCGICVSRVASKEEIDSLIVETIKRK